MTESPGQPARDQRRAGHTQRLEDILELRMPERRLVGRVLAYWQDKRRDRAMPAPEDMVGMELGRDWAHCILMSLGGPSGSDETDPTILHMGMVIQGLCGVLVGGRLHVVLEMLDLAERKVRLVERDCRPVLLDEDFPISAEERLVARAVILPLGTQDSTVTHILAAANGKTVPAL